MTSQFKKGILELIVLMEVSKQDIYGYELVSNVSKVIDVNEGTIYPLLKRLTNEHYFETYLEESSGGPPRKYYKITTLGKKRKRELLKSYKKFNNAVNKYMKEWEK